MNDYRVLLFYKYVNVDNPEKFKDEHLEFCLKNNLRGRVFFANEGINGTVSGLKEDTDKYKMYLKFEAKFNDIIFKEDEALCHAFVKMHVRVKEEIVNSKLFETSLSNGGTRLSPEQLLKFYEEGKEFIIVDARNNYESRIGKFKDAITPDIKNFREWKKAVAGLNEYKSKTIVTYCTGGVRCEKASAYMIEQGFEDIYQLDGGIVTFTKQFPDTYWQGGIFVFDGRKVIEPNTKEELKYVSSCSFCGEPASYYINCHNLECDKLIVCCHKCKTEKDYCCSNECRKAPHKRKKFYD